MTLTSLKLKLSMKHHSNIPLIHLDLENLQDEKRCWNLHVQSWTNLTALNLVDCDVDMISKNTPKRAAVNSSEYARESEEEKKII